MCYYTYTWPLWYSLVRFELAKDIWSCLQIKPTYVKFELFTPIEAIIVGHHLHFMVVISSIYWRQHRLPYTRILVNFFKSKFFSCLFYHIVYCIMCIYYKSSIWFFFLLRLYNLLYTPSCTIPLILTVYLYSILILINHVAGVWLFFTITFSSLLIKSGHIQVQPLYIFFFQIFIENLSGTWIVYLNFLFKIWSLQDLRMLCLFHVLFISEKY